MVDTRVPGASVQVETQSPPPHRGRQGAASHWRWSAVKENWPIWLVAGTTLLSGALSTLQMLFVHLQGHSRFLSYMLPFGLHYWGRSLTLIFGFMLIYLSLNLFQRRQVAWWLASVASVLLVAAHILSGRLWYLALAPAIAFVLLLIFRRRFTVRSEPSSIRRGIVLMVISLLIGLAYGTLGFWLLKTSFSLHFSLGDSIIRALRQITLVGNTDLVAYTREARWFLQSLSALAVVAWIFAAYSLFRPVAFRLQVLPHERAMAKAILERHGRSPYDFFKVWPDKSYFFSDSQGSFIAYTTVRGVALILGDPVGPEDEMQKVASSFLDYCSNNGWVVCFLLPDLLPMYQRLGLQVLKIGEEAIVDLEQFYSRTGRNRYFGYHKRHFEREGYRFMRYKPPHPAVLLDEIEEVSKEWLSLPKHRELGFLQGRFERNYIEKTPICVVRDPSGHVIAFLNEVPSYRSGEATFDMMRHRPGVPNATMDYLFQGTMFALQEEGYHWFNMGVAPFAGLGNSPGAPLVERILGLTLRMNWFVSAQGMRYYKVKFKPVWQDRFVAYSGGLLGLIRMTPAVTKTVEG
jgi:phosphatidylglycerol lysyltransferase